jgi:hypothetical protein
MIHGLWKLPIAISVAQICAYRRRPSDTNVIYRFSVLSVENVVGLNNKTVFFFHVRLRFNSKMGAMVEVFYTEHTLTALIQLSSISQLHQRRNLISV